MWAAPRNISVTLPRGQSATLTKEAKLDLPLIAPLPLRSRVGEYVVSAGDEVVARIPLVTLTEVKEGGLWTTATDSIRLWFE